MIKTNEEVRVDYRLLFSYFLLGNPLINKYRIKEQKKLVSIDELLTRFTFHLKMNNKVWEKFCTFCKELQIASPRSYFNDWEEIDIPVTGFHKKPLMHFSSKDNLDRILPVLKRAETSDIGYSFLVFVLKDLNLLNADIECFNGILKALVTAMPASLFQRERNFLAAHLYTGISIVYVLIDMLSEELLKYGYGKSEIKSALTKNSYKIGRIFIRMRKLMEISDITELPKKPLLLIRDFARLKNYPPVDDLVEDFLQQCNNYLIWLSAISKIEDKELLNKKRTVFKFLNDFSKRFHVWVRLPFDKNKIHYVIKIELLDTPRFTTENAPIQVSSTANVSQSFYVENTVRNYFRKLTKLVPDSKYLTQIFNYQFYMRKGIGRLFATILEVKRKMNRFTYEIRNFTKASFKYVKERLLNCISSTWFFPITKLGDSDAYHFEFLTEDPYLNFVDFGLYEETQKKFLGAEQVFGVSRCTKGHIHLYTTQKNFSLKEISLIQPCLWVRMRVDLLRLWFYFCILLTEIFLLYSKACNIRYCFENKKEMTVDFSFIPLLAVAVTLVLVYKTSILADQITKRWRRYLIGGLFIYLINCFSVLFFSSKIEMNFIPVLLLDITLYGFCWYILWDNIFKRKNRFNELLFLIIAIIIIGLILI
ncbi:MAG: hypothetical protein WBB37_11945 [bacterium]